MKELQNNKAAAELSVARKKINCVLALTGAQTPNLRETYYTRSISSFRAFRNNGHGRKKVPREPFFTLRKSTVVYVFI